MSTLKVNTLQTAAGVEVYTAKAWVNFNGTGTVAIRGSGNVTDITDNGTGDYTVNFTTAMPDANYCISTSIFTESGSIGSLVIRNDCSQSSSSFTIKLRSVSASALVDGLNTNFSVFR